MSTALESLEPIDRPETLGRMVREQLRDAIMAGAFTPGERLTLRAVAGALDVSLTPAREALYALASEGALELKPNGSIYVPDLSIDDITELTKIRVELEALAAREAVVHMDDAEIARIEAINDRLIAADGRRDYGQVIPLNWQFHFSIYRASGMPHLVRMIESCWLKTGSYLNRLYPEFGRADTGLANHRRIVAALKARDAEALARAIVTDIEFASASLLAQIRGRE